MLMYDDSFVAAMTATTDEATMLGARMYGSEHVLLGLLALFHVKAHIAALAGLATSLIVAIFVYGMPASLGLATVALVVVPLAAMPLPGARGHAPSTPPSCSRR